MFYNELIYLNNNSSHIRIASNFALEKISDILIAKGLDPQIAMLRTQEVFSNELQKASLYLQNIQHVFTPGLMKNVYVYISHKALLKSPINFSSYDELLGMMQQTSQSSLSEEDLRRIRTLSQANNYGIALVS